ncbi:MAG: hypothetical protein EHM43_02360 [Ignavibacteriae bacterium]|nr:MAG: hypothetical protein EHM43_02360 [Ignavibacteriota bacterium]
MSFVVRRPASIVLRWSLVVCGLWLAVNAYGQSSVSSKKDQLKNLRQSIEATQKQLDKLAKEERNRTRSLTAYQRQQHQVSSFIAQLEGELARLKDSANILKEQISETRAALDEAERSYNTTAQNLMKLKVEQRGLPQSSVTTDVVFRELSSSLKRYRAQMLQLKDSLEAEEDLLTDYSSTQQQVLTTKSVEERRLATTIKRNNKELEKIRANKQALAAELKQKKNSAAKLRQIINQQVAEARRKADAARAREAQRRKRAGRPAEPEQPAPSETVRGFGRNSLPWPTGSQKILHSYGAYKNPSTGTTFENPGIDISVPIGSSVKSVASGTVSSVSFLPGFGSLVIIDHGNGVRSVYANLENVRVQRGASVNTGSVIGSSGENLDGPLVHFEIWNGRERQNPLIYLR